MNEDSFLYLDLRGTPCPLNFVRCNLAIEKLSINQSLKVDIDKGEPFDSIIPGLKKAGHHFQIENDEFNFVTLIVKRFDSYS